MRVHPEISSVANSTINLGNGIQATEFNDEFVDTTVVVEDGETVAIGGMISKHDVKTENKVPWLGDLPGIGALFRFRQQDKNKTELLVILTPHIIRTRMAADQILAQESKRMDWTLGEVMRIHGSTGMEPILHPDPPQPLGPEVSQPPLCPDNQPASEVMPAPRSLPPTAPLAPGTLPAAPPDGSRPPMSKSSTSPVFIPAVSSSTPLSAAFGGRGQGEGGNSQTANGASFGMQRSLESRLPASSGVKAATPASADPKSNGPNTIVPASFGTEPGRWNVNPPG
jgi:hypothetical protein